MRIAGVGSNPYNYYGMQYPKNNQTKNCAAATNTANVALQEMMALNANNNLNGKESFGDELWMSAGRLTGMKQLPDTMISFQRITGYPK